MIVQTSFRETGAASLLRYIARDERLRDRAGRELSDREVRGFVQQSDHYEFERDMILSPERGDELGDRAFERAARGTVTEWERNSDRPRGSCRWVYAVHRDTDHPHVHVAMTGTKHDLYMSRDDIEEVRTRGYELFREQEREHERENEAEVQRGQSRDRGDRGVDVGR